MSNPFLKTEGFRGGELVVVVAGSRNSKTVYNILGAERRGDRSDSVVNFRRLKSREPIKRGDIIEDVQTGKYEFVTANGFYAFAEGLPAESLKQLPQVNEVLRPE